MGADPFDPAEFLDSEEAQAEYVRAALDTGDAGFVARSLAGITRARYEMGSYCRPAWFVKERYMADILLLARRFEELAQQMEAVEATKVYDDAVHFPGDRIDKERFLGWKVKARNLISTACGKESEHYRQFVKSEEPSMYRTNY